MCVGLNRRSAASGLSKHNNDSRRVHAQLCLPTAVSAHVHTTNSNNKRTKSGYSTYVQANETRHHTNRLTRDSVATAAAAACPFTRRGGGISLRTALSSLQQYSSSRIFKAPSDHFISYHTFHLPKRLVTFPLSFFFLVCEPMSLESSVAMQQSSKSESGDPTNSATSLVAENYHIYTVCTYIKNNATDTHKSEPGKYVGQERYFYLLLGQQFCCVLRVRSAITRTTRVRDR